MQVGRHAAHIVVDGRQNRDRFARDIDTGEDLRRLADAGQALMQKLGAEMLQMEQDVILLRAAAAALRHRTFRCAGHAVGLQSFTHDTPQITCPVLGNTGGLAMRCC
jgi:hypothetical protein